MIEDSLVKNLEGIMTPIQWIILSAVILAVILLLVLAVLLIGWQNRRRGVDGKKR